MDKQEKKGIAIGAAIGAVVGVVSGILFAPKSGKETRKDIKDGAVKAADKTKEEAEKLQQETKELIAKLEERVKKTSGKVSETAKEHVASAKHIATNISTVLKSVKAGEASDKDLNIAIKKAKDAQKSLKTFLKK